MSNQYLIDQHVDEARRRLRLLEALDDPGTILQLEATGVESGWTCLEVGAGGGSIAGWLCRRVTSAGRVVAVDLETRFLRELSLENLEIREHDILDEPPEEEIFDLVHERSVLMHIPERERALLALARAVKPGGWLVVEEPDASGDAPDPSSPSPSRMLYRRVTGAVYDFVRERGVDPSFGRNLGEILRQLGFEDVHVETRKHEFRGGTRPHSPHMPALRELRDSIVARGGVTETEYDDFLGLEDDPSFRWSEGTMFSARGRKPV